MLSDRFRTLRKAYSIAARDNTIYNEAKEKVDLLQAQREFLIGLQAQLKAFDLEVTQKESDWRQGVLGILEMEIMESLAMVYPTDGYTVRLSSRVLRGKIHIEASVRSTFSQDIPGSIGGTQGRLFQQVVSFSALEAVMDLIGIKTIYIDEAFSGGAKRNIKRLNNLLERLREKGFNLVMIAQDSSMADGIPSNKLFLSRSLDNKTAIAQEVSVQ